MMFKTSVTVLYDMTASSNAFRRVLYRGSVSILYDTTTFPIPSRRIPYKSVDACKL